VSKPTWTNKGKSLLEIKLRNVVTDIEMSREAIANMRAKANFEYVAWNAHGGIDACLVWSCLVLRGQNDREGARQAIHMALEFVPAILEAVDAVQRSGRTEENFVHCGNFRHAFVALFIAQQWALAKTLGEAILLDAVTEEADQDSPNDIEPKMFAALARNDPAGFEGEYLRFKRSLDDDDYYYREYFSIYEPLMQAIARPDTGMDFDAGLRAAEARYVKRAKDKIYDDTTEVLDGGKKVEGLTCDVYALALANLARHRGLSVSYSSPLIPTDVFAEPIL
jgi:hypothetical protein